ncbi:MAG: TIR domain-containing protein [Chitinophagaceae bacterium]
MSDSKTYDVFLSYNSADANLVDTIALKLKEKGITIFLDRWYLVPGTPWPQHLEQVLNSCHAVAVLLGTNGMGSWQLREQQLALDRQTKTPGFRVIPVLLPASDPPLGFLSLNTWIDFRQGVSDDHAVSRLALAIRGMPAGADLQRNISDALASICPYRGLKFFREEDAPFFFGRDAFISKLETIVSQRSLVAVIGASGSGKSSVVRAGLLPRLRLGKNGEQWDIITMVPGDQPLKNLAASLLPLIEPDMKEVDRLIEVTKLADALGSRQVSLRDVIKIALQKQPGTNKLMLIVDQWEEVYAPAINETTRIRLLDELLDAVSPETLSIVLTLRGDFYNQVLTYRPFSDRLQDGVVNISQMNREELKEVIESPAHKVGLSFETGLVNRILEKVEGQPGSMPLLEFVLMELWKLRQGSLMTHNAYEVIGEVDGAIAAHAESVFTKLLPIEQDITRRVFLQLIHPGFTVTDVNVQPTRRRTSFSEFEEGDIPVIRKLADAHLVVIGRNDINGEEIIDLVHEALILEWERLRNWIEDTRAFLNWREQLRTLVAIAKMNNYEGNTFLQGKLLAEAKQWILDRPSDLSTSEKDYIRYSLAATKNIRDKGR